MEEEKTKQELLIEAQQLAEKHQELKKTILKMLDDLDKIEIEYNRIVDKIKEN